jgi:hypothetical protein
MYTQPRGKALENRPLASPRREKHELIPWRPRCCYQRKRKQRYSAAHRSAERDSHAFCSPRALYCRGQNSLAVYPLKYTERGMLERLYHLIWASEDTLGKIIAPAFLSFIKIPADIRIKIRHQEAEAPQVINRCPRIKTSFTLLRNFLQFPFALH